MDGLIAFEKEANDRYIINVIGVFIVLQIATNDRYINDGKNWIFKKFIFWRDYKEFIDALEASHDKGNEYKKMKKQCHQQAL